MFAKKNGGMIKMRKNSLLKVLPVVLAFFILLQAVVGAQSLPYNSRSDCLAYFSSAPRCLPVQMIVKLCSSEHIWHSSVPTITLQAYSSGHHKNATKANNTATTPKVNNTVISNNTAVNRTNMTTPAMNTTRNTTNTSVPGNIIVLNNSIAGNGTGSGSNTPANNSVPSKGIFGINAMTTNIWMDNIPTQLAYWRQQKMKYLIVDVGDTGSNGLITTPKSEIQSFITEVSAYEKQSGYNFIVLPYSEVNTDNYNFNSAFAANMASDYATFVSMGFDGAYVDVEPVKLSQRTLYIQMLQLIRQKLPTATIAVYSANLDEATDDWAWPYAFFKQVSDNTDLIELQGYDEGFSTTSTYQNYLVQQVKAVSAKNWTASFMLGVPTHNPAPETLNNALVAYKSALSAYPVNPFIGVSVFAEWTIKASDWATFSSLTGI
jgi:hypothetical protein